MKLEKAIDELRNQCCVPNSEFMKPEYQARALAIEAMEVVKGWRKLHAYIGQPLLPGETEE